MMRSRLLIGLLASILVASADEEQLVKAEFRVFPVLNVKDEGIFYQPAPDDDMVELRFRPRARSIAIYDYEGPPMLRFFREAGVDEEGEMQYRTVGQVKVNAEEMLIFFANARNTGEDKPEFSLLALDDSPGGLPSDHVAFLNFTPVDFVGRFMDKNVMLQPGANDAISVAERLNEDIFIGLAVTNQETHRVVLKNRWQFHKGNRHYILLLPPRRAGSFRIRTYRISEFVGENQRFYPESTTSEPSQQKGVSRL